MDIGQAQRDIARAYVGGAPGVLISGLVWLVTGMVQASAAAEHAFLVLVLGGMAIFPVSTLIARFLLRAPVADRANPLNRLALESTFVLMAGMLAGYAVLEVKPDQAIPVFCLLMGARYFSFRTVYGEPLYWALAGTICLVGTLALIGRPVPIGNVALQVALIEMILSLALFRKHFSQNAARQTG